MQHKFLLRFIKDEMVRQKIEIKNNEAFFRLFMADEPWEAYRSNMSNWLSSKKDGTIHKYSFIAAINEKLGLPMEIWGASEAKQKEAVVDGVQRFKKLLQRENTLFSCVEECGLSREQEAFLAFAKVGESKQILERMQRLKESFVKRSHTQKFLIALLEVLYERGEYLLVYEEVFPYLLETYDNNIKAKKAHIYASLPEPMYREAFDILNSIRGESVAQTLDLQTAAISNIRRERFTSPDLNKESLRHLLKTFIGCYAKRYTPKEPQSYYVGINLAYMLELAEHICDSDIKEGYSVGQIYDDVSHSIAKAKDSELAQEQYYGSITQLEFQLLLGKKGQVQELEYLLEMLQPSFYLVDQTRRQMGLFFVEVLHRFASTLPAYVDDIDACLKIFDAYLQLKRQR